MEIVQVNFEKLNKLSVITNFQAFFLFLFEKYFLLDPDPGGKNECGSMRIRIQSPDRDLNI